MAVWLTERELHLIDLILQMTVCNWVLLMGLAPSMDTVWFERDTCVIWSSCAGMLAFTALCGLTVACKQLREASNGTAATGKAIAWTPLFSLAVALLHAYARPVSVFHELWPRGALFCYRNVFTHSTVVCSQMLMLLGLSIGARVFAM